jgi:hypothetical protein
MSQIIVYSRVNGGVSVVVPASDISLEEIIQRDIPSNVEVYTISSEQLPKDIDFRDCWELINGSVNVNISQAKEVWKNKWREARKPKLEQLDIDYMRALEQGDTQAQQEIVQLKQALRDVTETSLPNTLEGIKSVWPEILN